jgi:hypothetical protein
MHSTEPRGHRLQLTTSQIEYTYGHLVATLAMVESPTAAIFEPVATEDPDAPLNNNNNNKLTGPTEPELLLVKQAPITAKLRMAVRYLRQRAGFWSRFRGISLWIVYHFLFALLSQFFSISRFIPMGVSGVLAAVILARLRMGWTHIVISEPSTKYWFQRLPNWGSWKKIVLPTFVLAVCEQISAALPKSLWFCLGLSRFNDPQKIADLNNAERNILLLKCLIVVLLGLFSTIAIVIPAVVTLTRVQASLLPDEVETIVPFDRSFGGKVVPAIVGGSGAISMLEAWKTFDWNARVRILKIYGKVFAMQIAVIFIFAFVIGGQLNLIMGPEVKKYASWVKGSMSQ